MGLSGQPIGIGLRQVPLGRCGLRFGADPLRDLNRINRFPCPFAGAYLVTDALAEICEFI